MAYPDRAKGFGARDVAVLAMADRSGNVSAHLERLLAQSQLSAVDRGLARELALGSLRRRGTLDYILRGVLAQPGRKLPTPMMEILEVALYQVLYLTRIPEFAAVNEAVEQCARHHHRKQGGLVNGVLRGILRRLSPPREGRPPLDAAAVPTALQAYRTFDAPIFPDPKVTPAAYLAAAYSLPSDLAARWVGRHGMATAAELAMQASAAAPQVVRVNALRASVEEAKAALAAEGVDAAVHANATSLVLAEHQNVAELAAFKAGLFQPQDPTATAVGLAAVVKAGMKVLDLCAAPGTKTTHLAELMGNAGQINAVDISAEKLQWINDNCARLGITIVRTHLAEAIGGMLTPESYDVVLADVPCSNTGVLARRPEARWRFDAKALGALAKDQRFLAAAGAHFTKPGGRFIYSTCSIEPEEDAQLAAGLLKHDRNLRLVREQLTLPAGADAPLAWHDGGYIAIFEKR